MEENRKMAEIRIGRETAKYERHMLIAGGES